jgi:photosystem II stability/assembly factor-like uncharacterized protein
MKILISTFILLFTLLNICYSQCGWVTQNGNTANDLRDVQFVNTQTGWAVGFYGTIRKTTNGGVNWFQQYSSIVNDAFICCYFPNDMTGWIAGGHQTQNKSYIFKTTDGGNSWVNQYYDTNSKVIMKIWFSGLLNGWAAGVGGKILATTNGGQTWTQQNSGITNDLTTIFFINANSGWAAGAAGVVLRTTTGGAIWSPYYSGTTQNLEGMHFVSSLTGWAVGLNGTIIKTTDGGMNWTTKPSGSTKFLNSVCFVNYNTGWASGGDFYVSGSGQILRTTNGGDNWTAQSVPAVSWLADVHMLNADVGWAVGRNGSVLNTINGGLSAPLAPTLVFPLNNAINVPVNTTFRWSQVDNAQHYTIQVSTVPNFAVITDSITVDTNLYNIPNGKLTSAITYFWRVNARNTIGVGAWSTVWTFSTSPVGIMPVSNTVPNAFKVYDAYPNPFNPSTRIKFDVPKSSSVRILVYDMTGRQVDNLFEGYVSAGTFETVWKADKFNSGIYLIKFISNEFSSAKKLMLIK